MNNKEGRTSLLRPSMAVHIALSLWIVAVFLFHLLLFTPPIVLSIAEQFNLREPLTNLRAVIQPFFQTSDFSTYIKDLFF